MPTLFSLVMIMAAPYRCGHHLRSRKTRRCCQPVLYGPSSRWLPKLLGSNVDERWMVTEYFPNGTLEDHLLEYRGNPALALEAFRSVVKTASLIHKEGIVHRDFKPANIFCRRKSRAYSWRLWTCFRPR
jgi:serine/threonine protein kinase